jgi:divalent metal cation (Fe/Co/Zn/Cd) transporter
VASGAAEPDRRRERTLLVALLLSAWGPLVTGIAVLLSQSTTQLADFVRRSVELVALATSYGVFRHLRRRPDMAAARAEGLRRRATLTVTMALATSGVVMLLLIATRLRAFEPGGDVRLGLAIAILGLIVNSVFWRRYRGMTRERPDTIIDAQGHLYRAKAAVDAAVIAALATVLLAPQHPATRWVDLGGSVAVGAYLLLSAWQTAQNSLVQAPDEPDGAEARPAAAGRRGGAAHSGRDDRSTS